MKKTVSLIVVILAIHTSCIAINQKNGDSEFGTKTEQYLAALFNASVDYFKDEQVLKVSLPRNDLQVTIQGWPIQPFMGTTTWFSFKQAKKNMQPMVMGDVVLLEHEVAYAMKSALDNNIAVTALHHHFFFDTPKIYFMHIEGEGPIQKLAQACKNMIQSIRNAPPVSPLKSSKKNNIDGTVIEKIVGVTGQAKDGMYKLIIGRTIKSSSGDTIGKNMGINTWAAFAGTQDYAIMDGDFVVLESELQNVLKALTNAGISVVAIHNHMTFEKPRLIFLHFWGNNTVELLAQGFKQALNKTQFKEK